MQRVCNPLRQIRAQIQQVATGYAQTMTVERGLKMPRTRGSGSIYKQKGSAAYWVKYYRNGSPSVSPPRQRTGRKRKNF